MLRKKPLYINNSAISDRKDEQDCCVADPVRSSRRYAFQVHCDAVAST